MAIKILNLLTALLLISNSLSAQDEDRNEKLYLSLNAQNTFHINTNFEMLNNNQVYSYESEQAVTFTTAYDIEVGYFVVPKKLALGLSVGLESNGTFGVAYIPQYISLKYMLSEERNTTFLLADLGRVSQFTQNYCKGNAYNLGIGKKQFFTDKLALNVALVYSIRQINYKHIYRSVEFPTYGDQYFLNAQGIEIRVGLFF